MAESGQRQGQERRADRDAEHGHGSPVAEYPGKDEQERDGPDTARALDVALEDALVAGSVEVCANHVGPDA